jgi:hypothetical protein
VALVCTDEMGTSFVDAVCELLFVGVELDAHPAITTEPIRIRTIQTEIRIKLPFIFISLSKMTKESLSYKIFDFFLNYGIGKAVVFYIAG